MSTPEAARELREESEGRSVPCHRCGARVSRPCRDSDGGELAAVHSVRAVRARNPWPGDARPAL